MDVLALLSRASADLGPRLWIELTIGMVGKLYRAGKASLESCVRGLFSLVLDNRDNALTNEEMGTIYWLDDAYDLAVRGTYGTVEDVKKEFLAFTEPYLTIVRNAEGHMIGSRIAPEEPSACPNHP